MSKNASKIRKASGTVRVPSAGVPLFEAKPLATEAEKLKALQEHVPKLHNALRDAHHQRSALAQAVEDANNEQYRATVQRDKAINLTRTNLWLGMGLGLVVGSGFAALALNFG